MNQMSSTRIELKPKPVHICSGLSKKETRAETGNFSNHPRGV